MNKAKLSIGKTYNMGNYESLRLDVGMEVDYHPNYESIFNVLNSIRDDIMEYLEELEEKHGVHQRKGK